MGFDNQLQTMMMLAGIGILCWIMMRGRMKSQKVSEPRMAIPTMKHNANAKAKAAAFSGTSSVGAPPEVLKWQIEMYDLSRQLKAELDSKMIAVRKLTADYDRATAQLNQSISEAELLALSNQSPIQLARRLSGAGCSADQISKALVVPVHQVELWLETDPD